MTGEKINKFSFIEPLGHDAPQTKIERCWSSFFGPYGLQRSRDKKYAPNSNMTFLPMQYELVRFELEDIFPDDQWIVNCFNEFVRDEFSSSTLSYPEEKWPIKIEKIIDVSEKYLQDFLIASDSTIMTKEAAPKDNSAEEIAKSIYEILCHEKIGAKQNRKNNKLNDFIKGIIPAIKDKSRLLFVLPGFPFKDQNRFRVPYEPDQPDMAEIAFMIRLYKLTQSIYQVHPFGADVIVLTDGDLYKDVFGIENNKVKNYHRKLIEYRNKFNLQGTLSFISLKDMLDRASDTLIPWNMINHIKVRLNKIIENNYSYIEENFNILRQGMKWNLNSRNIINTDGDKECWNIICGKRDVIESECGLNTWDIIHKRGKDMAIEYAATNLMLRRTDLIRKFFPDAIRGTVHPKPGQFGLAGNTTYAWNGIAWSNSWPESADDIKVKSYWQLSECNSIKQVVLENRDMPLFFTATDFYRNELKAKKAFPLIKWRILDLKGCPFSEHDLLALQKLAFDDKNFSWERVIQEDNYFHELLKFRLAHYEKYGFGIHGIWLDDKLIGQCGLQVIEKEADEVEFVIFLGKDHIGKKYGSVLLNYLIGKCKREDMDYLYAIVRIDNDAGIALTKKFGGIRIAEMKHFNENAIKFKIDLRREL